MNGGHVILDTTGMVYDRLAAYYDDICEKVEVSMIIFFFLLKKFNPLLSKKRSAVSLPVQRMPSSHGAVLLECTQPVAGLQLSSVQTLPSLQFSAGPPTQAPFAQASLVVH